MKIYEKAYKRFEQIPFKDTRGTFERLYCSKRVDEVNPIKQVNHSFTFKKGTIRGLHFQKAPFQETKFMKVIRGKIFDVILNVDESSSDWGQFETTELSEFDNYLIKIPKTYAHGFQTLTDNVSIIYFHDVEYSKEFEDGFNYLSPRLDIKWPLEVTSISNKDLTLPMFE